MRHDTQHIAKLLFKRLYSELTPDEEQELADWQSVSRLHRDLVRNLDDQDGIVALLQQERSDEKNDVHGKLFKKIIAGMEDIEPIHQVHFLKTVWFKAAVAVLLIASGIALYFALSPTPAPGNKELVQTQDVPPGQNRAVLTLSNGEKIELNSAASETIQDENLSIENHNGQLNYYPGSQPIPSNGGVAPGAANPRENHSYPGAGVGYNTMTTPRGGQYQLTLADGTKVWLNAASSITYPTAFKGKTREITINGEAYFEVAKNKEKPFIVKTDTDQIIVLGTSFNVNDYADSYSSKISLVEGSVKINSLILTPGNACLNGKLIKTDIEQDIAWTRGLFNFNRLPLDQALQQIARWYDVQIIFEGKAPNIILIGEVGRDLTLSQMMQILKDRGVKYQINYNKKIVTIMQ